MNKIQINLISELQDQLEAPSWEKGLTIIETSLLEDEIIKNLEVGQDTMKVQVSFRGTDQPINEKLLISLIHKLKNQELNKTLTSSFQRNETLNDSIINHLYYESLSLLKNNNIRRLLFIMGKTPVTTEDTYLLEDAIEKLESNIHVIIFMHHNFKQTSIENTNMIENKKVYISYKHLDKQHKAIQELCRQLEVNNIDYVIDEKDLKYKDNIEDFEQKLGQGEKIIVIITPDYLHSVACMYELKEIFKNSNAQNRVIPIVDLENIPRDINGLYQIKTFWKEEKDKAIQLMSKEPGRNEISAKQITKINDFIEKLDDIWEMIMNVKTVSMAEEMNNDFKDIVNALQQRKLINPITPDFGRTNIPELTADRTIKQGEKCIYIENNQGPINIS